MMYLVMGEEDEYVTGVDCTYDQLMELDHRLLDTDEKRFSFCGNLWFDLVTEDQIKEWGDPVQIVTLEQYEADMIKCVADIMIDCDNNILKPTGE